VLSAFEDEINLRRRDRRRVALGDRGKALDAAVSDGSRDGVPPAGVGFPAPTGAGRREAVQRRDDYPATGTLTRAP
jgi:hypothetical protein